MLLQFNFKNFKSFRDDTSLDLTATKISEYPDHVRLVGYEKVLPAAAIYGANASGKSNIIDALRYMRRYVVSSFGFADQIAGQNDSSCIKPTSFWLDNTSRRSESTFEVYFIDTKVTDKRTYHYGFSVTPSGICEEWLNYRPKSSRGEFHQVFYRHNNDISYDKFDKRQRDNIGRMLQSKTLLVSLGAKLNIPGLRIIYDWFYHLEIVDFANQTEIDLLLEHLPEKDSDRLDMQHNMINYLKALDSSITGLTLPDIIPDNDTNQWRYQMRTQHNMIDSDEQVELPWELESAGTKKMIALYPVLEKTLAGGHVLVIDELATSLHPLLVRTIILTFANPEINQNHAQLIFTSHDTWHLNKYLLRRDEIWFTQKNSDGISELYSLADFDHAGTKIRKDENFEKNYLLGKYGAIPEVDYFPFVSEAVHESQKGSKKAKTNKPNKT